MSVSEMGKALALLSKTSSFMIMSMQDPSVHTTSTAIDEAARKRRRAFLAEMRAKGYKRSVRWVPGISNSVFVAEYRLQIEALAEHHRTHGIESFLPPEEDLPGWRRLDNTYSASFRWFSTSASGR